MPKFTEEPILTPRFGLGLAYAEKLHRKQVRKGPLSDRVPYIAHLMSVAALVLEDRGSETEAIAALLHDAVEDIGGSELEGIRVHFGELVAGIVLECTDTIPAYGALAKAPWRERKEHHIKHAQEISLSALRVLMADKLHNLLTLEQEYAAVHDELWSHFNATKEETIWYYLEMESLFRTRLPESLLAGRYASELKRFVSALQSRTRSLTATEARILVQLRDMGGAAPFEELRPLGGYSLVQDALFCLCNQTPYVDETVSADPSYRLTLAGRERALIEDTRVE